jgi:glucans biosynthesis protein
MPFGLAAAFRRSATTACFLLAAMSATAAHAAAFGFDAVALKAEQLSKKPWQPPRAVPQVLKDLSYDQLRDIRFKPERALWRKDKLPFELMFFHLGKYQIQPVSINEVLADGSVKHVAYDPRDFDYGQNKLSPETWGDVGLAGFRVHAAMNTPTHKDEVVVFLGASYMRALGKNLHYGLSARGLAIDTVGGNGEEFPRFSEFWIERPAADATQLVIHALLESPRATGAYRFVLKPGDETVMDVQARLFLRAGVSTLGLAPLTSMFQHGENQPRPDDFRPEVHDSDGLSIASTDGEWLWRPLNNPSTPVATSFTLKGLAGFGLMQRDRSFANYEDTESRYERRPSAWVEPQGSWGPGRVELFQYPTPDETNDNVTAYWVPEKLPAAGQPLDFAYRLHWQGDAQQRPPGGWAVQSRRGHGYVDAKAPARPNEVQFVVDFDGPSLRALAVDAEVQAVATPTTGGRIVESNTYLNPVTGTWRMTLRAERTSRAQPLELRAFLQHGANALTETWTTIIPSE